MRKQYPIRFTSDDGTHVEVDRTGDRTLDFTLRPENGSARHFTFNEGQQATDDVEASLDFDELNALRRYWLEAEKDDMS